MVLSPTVKELNSPLEVPHHKVEWAETIIELSDATIQLARLVVELTNPIVKGNRYLVQKHIGDCDANGNGMFTPYD